MNRNLMDVRKLRAMGARVSGGVKLPPGNCKKCGLPLDRKGVKYHEDCRPAKFASVKQAGSFLGKDVIWDSKKEMRRGGELLLLLQAGKICDLARQVPFSLRVNGKAVATYKADFVYHDNEKGYQVIEDVKSEPTRRSDYYQLKKRLFEALYPGQTITEV